MLRVCVGVICLLVAAPAVVHAEDDPKMTEAEEHFSRGLTHYKLGEFDEAITEFKKAYELSNEPVILFNIAQAYRLKEDYKNALYFYRTYLREEPDASNRADVEKWISELERLEEERKRLRQAPPTGAMDGEGKPPSDGEQPLVPIRTSDTEPRGKGLKIAGIVTGVAGVVLAGTGIYFGMKAQDGWDEVNAASDNMDTWTPELEAVYQQAETDELTAKFLMGFGATAAVAGGVMWFIGWRMGMDGPAVTAAPTAGGGIVGVTWTY
jgi:tetratricopeptide (TPR) repeat protein